MRSQRHPAALAGWTMALLAATAIAPGCAPGHGTSTTEARRTAERNLAGMRAAAAYDSARQHFLAGELDEAMTAVEASLAAKPDVLDALVLRVRIAVEMGYKAKAIESIEAARKVAPDEPRLPYYRAVLAEESGDRATALEEYLQAARLAPERLPYKLAAAEMMIELGQTDQARQYLLEQIQAHPSSPGVFQSLGQLARMQGQDANAVQWFAQAHALEPGNLTLCEDYAMALVAVQRHAGALPLVQRILADRDYADRTDLQYVAACCLLAVDRPVEARELLRRLARSGKDEPFETWRLMADAAIKLDDHRLLRESAMRMMASRPKDPDGYLAMALHQQTTGDLAGAVATLTYCQKSAESSKLVDRYLEKLQSQATAASGGIQPPAR